MLRDRPQCDQPAPGTGDLAGRGQQLRACPLHGAVPRRHALLITQDALGLPFQPELGGSGEGMLTCCLVIEELTRVCYNTSYLLVMTWQPFYAISHAGTAEQKERFLPPLIRGEIKFSTANTEPEAGSDMAALKTRARPVPGGYRISGSKVFASNAAAADYFVTFANTDPSAGGKGITAFIVDANADGVTVDAPEDKIGGRAIPSCAVTFDDVEENRLGAEGQGFVTAATCFTKVRPLVGARAVGQRLHPTRRQRRARRDRPPAPRNHRRE
ncbi:acyl-CoA dehydrogenase family protein [Streptomyces sp. NPDC057684]|uniref:acyl-CoA dehydrogenase family protein n=1 Tax=Streptomyces sp. NPDC057684 TaxID=3346211 RepID=UPI0036B6CA73